MIRRQRRRRLAYGLLGFGLSGLALLLGATALVFASLGAVDDAASGFDRQRAELLAMLEPAADALDSAATSATSAGASLTSSADAADRAASFTTRLATSMSGLAALGSFEVFGARPFASLADEFGQVSSDAVALSTDLGTTAGALRTNVTDATAVAADLRALAAQLQQLGTSLGASDGTTLGGAAVAVNTARILLVGVLLWLAVPAVVCTWLGWRLLRRPGP
jgi:hypothetical protein